MMCLNNKTSINCDISEGLRHAAINKHLHHKIRIEIRSAALSVTSFFSKPLSINRPEDTRSYVKLLIMIIPIELDAHTNAHLV